MGLLDRISKKSATTSTSATEEDVVAVKPKAVSKKQKKDDAPFTVPASAEKEARKVALIDCLRRPHVSEKAARLADKGAYVFDVRVDAEKVAIKKAVEALYGVKVVGVRTIRHAGKPVRRGRKLSSRNAWKKALVTIAPGQKIEIYSGV